MPLTQDPRLRLFPVDLSRFGKSPYGDDMYRVVDNRTRYHKMYLPDGGEVELCTYAALKEGWVLERWHSAFEFSGMTPQQWKNSANSAMLGEYPSRGEYAIVEHFDFFDPLNCNFDDLIGMIEAGRFKTPQDNKDALQRMMDQEKKERNRMIEDIVLDKWSAFGTRDFAAAGHSRRGKGGKNFKLKASDLAPLGLPTKPGKVVTFGDEKGQERIGKLAGYDRGPDRIRNA